jgi:ATP-dependent DNA ligase
MDLPVTPPVAPMLARPSMDIPLGDYVYEPRWDGVRAIVFRDHDEVEIDSRNGRPMDRYFPELVAAVRSGLPCRCVVDGEIVVPDSARRPLDFEALQQPDPSARRQALFRELQPFVNTFEDHPGQWGEAAARCPHESPVASRWSADRDMTFVPVRPERVVEVRYDHREGDRFRHTTQFVRWRRDRDPGSCTFVHLEEPVRFDLSEVMG